MSDERRQLYGSLLHAAQWFGVAIQLSSVPLEGRGHSMGIRVTDNGGARWLRVRRASAQGNDPADLWPGAPTENSPVGLTKPAAINHTTWVDTDKNMRVRADLMPLVAARSCSHSATLHSPLDLPDQWWVDLRRSVDIIRTTHTTLHTGHHPRGMRHVRRMFGDELAHAFWPREWETMHGDLTWPNLLAPQFGLVDWDLWEPGPAGFDAALMYMHSLLVPEVAERVYDTFKDLLDSESGMAAQISAAARIFELAETGEDPELAAAVRARVEPLVAKIVAA